jgi:cation diffusion facilitator family transporter
MADTKHIFQSLAVNVTIVVMKGAAALYTGSGAMLAETLHSASDCANQILLLVGVKRSEKPPDDLHPLGYGRAMYFWSFIVALLLFSGGGVFSIYEGIHKLLHPEAVENALVGIAILAVSLVLEGWSTYGNVVEMNKRRGSTGLLRWLKDTKDSDLVVVFGENSAAVLGLSVALVAMFFAWKTGDGRFDAAGGIGIGVVLVGVALFLAREVHSLLLGERADAEVEKLVQEEAAADPDIEALLRIITIQQGPGEVLVAMKVKIRDGLTSSQVAEAINRFERGIRARYPAIKWCFVEPDVRV